MVDSGLLTAGEAGVAACGGAGGGVGSACAGSGFGVGLAAGLGAGAGGWVGAAGLGFGVTLGLAAAELCACLLWLLVRLVSRLGAAGRVFLVG